MNDRTQSQLDENTETFRRLERLVRPELRALTPYVVADAAGMIKLDAMENPHAWPQEMRAEWLALLADTPVNRYPDTGASGLKARLREAEGLADDQGLVLGNGSDELIQLLAMVFSRPGASVLSVAPTFVMYRRSAIAAGLEYVEVPLEENRFALDPEATLAAVARHRPSLIFFAYPNNPTGNLFDIDALSAVARAAEGLVVIDEAYAPFAGDTWLDRCREFENMVVMRTFSKLGLAGIRLGFLVGPSVWTAQLEKLRLPYNINVLTQRTGTFALERSEVFRRQTESICEQREALAAALARMEGVHLWPSRANFLLFRPLGADAQAVFEGLRRRKVLIKNLDGTAAGLSNCLRVTIGTADENAAFLAALEQTLADRGKNERGRG